MCHKVMTKKQILVRTILIGLASVLLFGGIGVWLIGPERIERKIRSLGTLVTIDRSGGELEFPDIDQSRLSHIQQKIVILTKEEFTTQASGEKFSEGASEAWCADFVSWIMKEADVPLKNPHTGGWRIPGTYTLKDYYVAQGRFREVGSGYVPKLGDVAIYQNSPIFGDHTNIVLSNVDGVLTTVGGNENNRVRVYENTARQYAGLLGYGVLE